MMKRLQNNYIFLGGDLWCNDMWTVKPRLVPPPIVRKCIYLMKISPWCGETGTIKQIVSKCIYLMKIPPWCGETGTIKQIVRKCIYLMKTNN